jgi:hypothetical protein
MLIRFIKDCVWSFSDGRNVRFETGTVDVVPDEEATRMIKRGYAEEDIAESENSSSEKSGDDDNSEFTEEDRRVFYGDCSRDSLVAICKKNIPSYMPSVHKNKSDLTDLIVAHEKDHGILKENKDA